MRSTTRVLPHAVVSDLRTAVTGDVITPTDPAYDEARSLWNGAIDRYPSVIVRAASTADVATAIADLDDDATAFGFRSPEFLLGVEAAWDDPTLDEECREWDRTVWETLREQSATVEGFYPGFPGFVEGEERARMAYGDNYDRLAAIKAEHDPENLLRHNLTVEPAR